MMTDPGTVRVRFGFVRSTSVRLLQAAPVTRHRDGEHLNHVVMLDPAGNEFCAA
jgi:hypothetical protein